MAEYINREETKRELSEWCILLNSPHLLSRDDTMFLLDTIPAADVAPVVHGRWIHSRYENCCDQFELVKCSHCSHEAYAMAFYVRGGNYCPNCGARMEGGNENDR